MKRRLAVVAGTASGLLLGVASPAYAQSAGSSAGLTLLKVVGALAAGGAIVLLGVLLFGPGAAVESDIRRRLGRYAGEDAGRRTFFGRFPLLRRFVSSAEEVATRRGMIVSIETALEQADIPLRPGEAMAAALALAVVLGMVAGLVAGNVIIGAVAVVLAILAVFSVIQGVARRERNRFERQLPDTLSLIATSLRAGYSLLQALEAVGEESPDPTSREFGRALSEIRLGRSITEALKDTAARMESLDFDWAVLAVEIQREVGGNLGEVLQTTAETMLQRNRLRREVKALTAEGRVSAIVLGSLPFGLFVFLFFTNRAYLEPLLDSRWGIGALIGSVALLTAGVVWLNRLVQVDV